MNFRGKALKVEEIRDHPKMGRVKVPDRLVSYVVGAPKKTSATKNKVSSLRNVKRQNSKSNSKKQHVSTKEQRKRKRQELQSQLQFPLSMDQQDELLRAARRGYLTLEGKSQSRFNPLANAHRQYCDEREQPHIVLCKADSQGSGNNPLDHLIVDLSPLRMVGVDDEESDAMEEFMTQWKAQILSAAATAGMELHPEYKQDNCHKLSVDEEEECFVDMDEGITHRIQSSDEEEKSEYTMTLSEDDSWAIQPISKLPVVTLGVFEGERSKAKAMAKELAELWGIPSEPLDSLVDYEQNSNNKNNSQGKRRGGKARRDRRNANKRERRNNQRELDAYFR